MARIVNVHHGDYASFLKRDNDYIDLHEIVVVFDTSPSIANVVEKVRSELN